MQDVWSQLTQQLFAPTGSVDKTDGKVHQQGDEKNAEDGLDRADPEADKGVVSPVKAVESYALCVGMPGAGKTSLLNAYLNPNNDGVPKPTVALEYMFARRAIAANAPKVNIPPARPLNIKDVSTPSFVHAPVRPPWMMSFGAGGEM